ncbi:ATP-binding protein [Neolewinella agarilytica]|uniref:ATP-binding protein n=1 Tax=Neolewinella agarilytica TaxID=478744 RepID=UPI0023547569|nr:ATP-binding protein [Neolewinella agarilytica]
MTENNQRYSITYDLTNCDKEPLRFIRCCQAHARMLIVLKGSFELVAYSENWAFPSDGVTTGPIGQPLENLISKDFCQVFRIHVERSGADLHHPLHFSYVLPDGSLRLENVIVHEQDDYFILEFEQREDKVIAGNFMLEVDLALRNIQSSTSLEETFSSVVGEVRKLTGFDRVMLYGFDEDYNGEVLAEDLHPSLSPFLGLRYPHTDIPRQARALYLSQEIRQVVSTAENSDALLIMNPGEVINLTQADNRGVSPIHLEYLRAMEVGASMSIAIIFENRLWGLIACHHGTEKIIDYRLRRILKFLARVVSGHIALQRGADYQEGVRVASEIRSNLVHRMNESLEIQETLVKEENQLQELVHAHGAAILLNGEFQRIGNCPTDRELEGLIQFLATKERNCWYTNVLFTEYPPSRGFSSPPAGLLSLRLTREPAEYIIWFRPETVQSVDWGGQPEQRKHIKDGRVRLHPELSFEKWTELVKDKALPWKSYEIDAAMALRNDLKEIILMKFQQVNGLNTKLIRAYDEMESFSYTVSHDLRAPLRSIKGYAKILEEDYAEALDEYGLSAINVILDNVDRMNQFISDMLEFSRLGRSKTRIEAVELTPMVNRVWQDIHGEQSPRLDLRFDVKKPVLNTGLIQLQQICLNLLSNSIKYSRDIDAPWVKFSSYDGENATVIEVADNGIGFNMKHANSIFTVFNRLVPDGKYEGSGIGLAIVKQMVEKLHGTISVQSTPGVGTTFTIHLPDNAG